MTPVRSFFPRLYSGFYAAGFAVAFAFCALVSLSACAEADNSDEKQRVGYSCDNGFEITAIYYGVPEDAGAELQINNRYFSFYSVSAELTDGGEKFATDQGLDEDTGLLWLRGDESAFLIEMSLDEDVDPADYPLITTCTPI